MCIWMHNDERSENGDGKEGREWRLPGLLYADDLVLYGKLVEDIKVKVEHFVKVCRRGLKINADKRKVIMLHGEEGMECEINVNGPKLKEVSEFKYLWYFASISYRCC